MSDMHQEVLGPIAKGNFLTRVTAFVRLGRGVTGNTTFGLWAIALVAIVLGVTFITCGYPIYALYLLGICVLWYLLYQTISWVGSIFSPDAGMTADEDYAKVVATRQFGANDPSLITRDAPVLGGSGNAIKPRLPKRKSGDE